ncbi:MAG: hypothetical protein ABEI32_02765 [Halothece sp.]
MKRQALALSNTFSMSGMSAMQDGRDLAAARLNLRFSEPLAQSRLPLDTFPTQPIASLEEVLNENWLPSNPQN